MGKPERKRPTTVWVAWHEGFPCRESHVVGEKPADVSSHCNAMDLTYGPQEMKPRRFVAVDDLRKMTRAEREAWLRRPR